jgi:hypothetical protein
MNDKWMIRGTQFVNCNCAWGCPCQFSARSTNGFCEGLGVGHIEEGYFNDTKLDDLSWILIGKWPGEIAEGNGRMQAIIDESADGAQREALRKILHGESTKPGATHFYVFNSTTSEVLDTLYSPIEVKIDVDARQANIKADGLVESKGTPIIDPFSQTPMRARINLPDGFEYTVAEMGAGTSKVNADLKLELNGSYGQFSVIHMNQDGVIR